MLTTSKQLPPSSCPSCGAMIQQKDIDLASTFGCPSCAQSLRASPFYSQRIIAASEVLAGLISYALGLRGVALASAVLLGFFPVSVVLISVARRFDAPKLRPSDAYSLNLNGRCRRGTSFLTYR